MSIDIDEIIRKVRAVNDGSIASRNTDWCELTRYCFEYTRKEQGGLPFIYVLGYILSSIDVFDYRIDIVHKIEEHYPEYLAEYDIDETESCIMVNECKSLVYYYRVLAGYLLKSLEATNKYKACKSVSERFLEEFQLMLEYLPTDYEEYYLYMCRLEFEESFLDQVTKCIYPRTCLMRTWQGKGGLGRDVNVIRFCRAMLRAESTRQTFLGGEVTPDTVPKAITIDLMDINIRNACFDIHIRQQMGGIYFTDYNDRLYPVRDVDILMKMRHSAQYDYDRYAEKYVEEEYLDDYGIWNPYKEDVLKIADYYIQYLDDRIEEAKNKTKQTLPSMQITIERNEAPINNFTNSHVSIKGHDILESDFNKALAQNAESRLPNVW